ncbi:DUF3179 domain-containing protein [Rhodohalobacter sp.]|uniref:DUF3179 domain-containing protein n=1 Tax=Rhodohalobacter sp. TaxID=1974210 RepID=UPI002ACEBE7C|nr:DUF3179 domain-containing protein [Rhodohalobacter sp.]MDZ7755548.1 DUF3179 domain-containing protein [Rhodohalobacter sp.]
MNTESANSQNFDNWKTDLSKKSIDLKSLVSGGPPKDGIPSINKPEFVQFDDADSWINNEEPVIAFQYEGISRAYPLQIMIWHEIVNDRFDDTPVLITFCPLCYSAIVFDRRIDGEVHEFGVSGFLRHSDMIMFDRKTESLWQQFTGEAVVGSYTGKELKVLPSQIISYEQFKDAYPDGEILSRETGHRRSYGQNPYAGYDDINNTPFLMGDIEDDRLKPMEKVVGLRINGTQKAYPYAVTEKEGAINDTVGEEPVVIFHVDGARSALDAAEISNSRSDGSTGAFNRVINGQTLEFRYQSGEIRDQETGSTWDISGKAVSGELEGEQLEPLIFGDYFAFAWMVFWPETLLFDN